jgi:hypothetical protein
MAKNTICLWYDKDAEATARFYSGSFLTAREPRRGRKRRGTVPAGLCHGLGGNRLEADRHAVQVRAIPRPEENQVLRIRPAMKPADPYNLSDSLHANLKRSPA